MSVSTSTAPPATWPARPSPPLSGNHDIIRRLPAAARPRTGGHSATAGDLIKYRKARVAAYKYPREVRVTGSLPKGPTGKILKTELR